MKFIQIGIIAGCGLDKSFKEDLTSYAKIEREDAKNDYGLPSSNLYTGKISGVDVVLLIRYKHLYKHYTKVKEILFFNTT
jgi:5'-methylthioadenosine phosphorylase